MANDQYAEPVADDSTVISLITCSPIDDEAYTLYGHTAIRVKDKNFDLVFNYGIFDFSKPYFIYRFAKGETDYMLGVNEFASFLRSYSMRGSELCEQILNLTASEKESLRQALIENASPENRVYRYNYFFDNCATRPAIIIEKHVDGSIVFENENVTASFRDIINYCTRNHTWLTFGCDIVIGLPADRVMTFRESFFLPENLRKAYSTAKIRTEPLVKQTTILNPAMQSEAEKDAEYRNLTFWLTSPLLFSWILFAIVLIITLQKKYKTLWLDCVLFIIAGIAGCLLFFLSFCSVHPCIFPNINLMWLHPLHLAGAIIFPIKKLKKVTYWYHFFNIAVIFTLIIIWFFIRQHFNPAFIPLILSLLLRSLITVKNKNA